jgi:hypothetical protein
MDTISHFFFPVRSIKRGPDLAEQGSICAHWGRWDSYNALRNAASICETCHVLRDWFRLHFSARFEEEAGHMEQLDDRICAQFPLAGNLLGRTASFQLRALESFAAVIEVRSGNAKMECVVILKTGAPFFIKGRLNKPTRSPFN